MPCFFRFTAAFLESHSNCIMVTLYVHDTACQVGKICMVNFSENQYKIVLNQLSSESAVWFNVSVDGCGGEFVGEVAGCHAVRRRHNC